MNFKKPDRLPWYEFVEEYEAIYRWIGEGLPMSEITVRIENLDLSGALPFAVSYSVFDVSRYFGFEHFTPPESAVTIDQAPLPRYFVKTLEETADYVVIRSMDGTKKKVIKSETFSMPNVS